MSSRRSFLTMALGAGVASSLLPLNASADAPDFTAAPPVQYPAGVKVPTVEEYLEELESVTGAKTPYTEEVALGKSLLKDIPKGDTPYGIAFRFHEWRRGAIGSTSAEKSQYSYYAREWPIRGNPVIMQFFDATGFRKPAGDTTYWCAAFVSWCIRESLANPGASKPWPFNEGAASAAYRNWGKDVIKDLKSSPKRGDLVVFENRKTSYAGHIGFVHDVTEKQIRVLGGNQGAQNEYNGGEVNIATFDRDGSKSLKLHSFRRHDILRVG